MLSYTFSMFERGSHLIMVQLGSWPFSLSSRREVVPYSFSGYRQNGRAELGESDIHLDHGRCVVGVFGSRHRRGLASDYAFPEYDARDAHDTLIHVFPFRFV